MLGGDIDAYSEADNLEYLAEMQREEEIRANLQSRISQVPQFTNPLPISQFLALANEVIVDDPQDEDLTSVIANRYAQANPQDTQLDIDKEEEEERIPVVKYQEVVATLDLLYLYEQQQEDGLNEVIRKLDAIKASFFQRTIRAARQSVLELLAGSISLARRER